ncbi:MAG: hypothetical protein JNM55_17880 [Anaerolineales bacterium]|nr:hypothetical protein [Anaerolineales bacterium]
MSSNSFIAKFLRFIGIVLMALTGGFTLLGGVGTTCAALAPTKYESMASLAPFQWLYILFVLTGIVIGVWGIWATIKLVKGTSDSYNMSIQALTAGMVIGFIHIYMSRMLRGKSMPVDAVVYTTVLTLIVFLLFRIPGIWQGVNFDKGGGNRTAGGAAAIILGLFTLTVQHTMASTHTWGGVNYADAFNTTMLIVGAVLVLSGAGYLIRFKNIRIIRPNPFLNSQHQT